MNNLNLNKNELEYGFSIDTLINDKSWRVRLAVAEQGYGLDKLINDKKSNVRNTAKYLIGSRTEILNRNFGTYNGLLSVRIWEDKYLIESGCYQSDSIDNWSQECNKQLGKIISDSYTAKIKELINS